jgi:hypothetical protein
MACLLLLRTLSGSATTDRFIAELEACVEVELDASRGTFARLELVNLLPTVSPPVYSGFDASAVALECS